MLTKEKMLKMAEAEIRRAKMNIQYESTKRNVNQVERDGLAAKLNYARIVYMLIREHYKEAAESEN